MSEIEKALKEGKSIQIRPQGYSMYPMLVPGRDEVILEPVKPDEVRRGDCILYRREGSILVLHRVYRVSKDGFYFTGDNQDKIEGPLPPGCIRGKVVVFIRNGKQISVKNPVYKTVAGLWLWLFPVRNQIKIPLAWLKKKLGISRRS